jgi:sugar phosphate isomerase/epimerase
VIHAAAELGVLIVGTFVGREKTKEPPRQRPRVPEGLAPALQYTEARGLKIAIENCAIFSWDDWPGGTNLASTSCNLGRDVLNR